MPTFTVTEEHDPLLSVNIGQGEKVCAVSRAMVTMDMSISLKGRLEGGVIRSLFRKKAQGDSLFLQTFEAADYPGNILLSPPLPGSIEVINLGLEEDLYINDGCFLASSSEVKLTCNLQTPGKAIFSGNGGIVLMKATGPGVVAICGFGSIRSVKMKLQETIIDHNHIVAWSAGIKYEVSTLAAGTGVLNGLLRGLTSGEGLVNRFAGTGNIYLCTRNMSELRTRLQLHTAKADASRK